MNLALFPAALLGGLGAFLTYNFHPAKAFMGDTGSLFLGGAVCGLAFALDIPLVLILVGFVYIVETLSDIIQVVYFQADPRQADLQNGAYSPSFRDVRLERGEDLCRICHGYLPHVRGRLVWPAGAVLALVPKEERPCLLKS